MNKKNIMVVVGVLAGLGLLYFGYNTLFFVSTDNAQIQARTIMIAAKVPGYVTKVGFDENQKVKKGDVLVEIDPRDYDNNLSQASNEMESTQARVHEADINFRRVSDLFTKGAVAQQQYDSAKALHEELSHKLEALQAQVEQAKLNLQYTQVRAPADGVVAKKSAEVGMLASPGAPLIGFVSSEERWITANFKETELKDIKVGKKVDIEVDSLSGEKFSGSVESIGAATGATFTLLPPDNATGNFTKVVQRVPVRIKFENVKPEDYDRLQAGLSVEVRIKK